jgi:hypothetical protein
MPNMRDFKTVSESSLTDFGKLSETQIASLLKAEPIEKIFP